MLSRQEYEQFKVWMSIIDKPSYTADEVLSLLNAYTHVEAMKVCPECEESWMMLQAEGEDEEDGDED